MRLVACIRSAHISWLRRTAGGGNLFGFTNLPSSNGTGIGQLGVILEIGVTSWLRMAFVNNGTQTSLSWSPDLVLGNWYWFTFEVVAKEVIRLI